jgi:hypothetical protein
VELSEALCVVGELTDADAVLQRAIEAAATAGDARAEAHARLEALLLRAGTDPAFETADLLEAAETAIEMFRAGGDELGLAKAWRAVAEVHLTTARWGLSADATERALEHARRAGNAREETAAATHLANALYWGPTPAGVAIDRCREMLSSYAGRPTVEANLLYYLGGLHGMQGDFGQALELVARGRQLFEQLGHRRGIAYQTLITGPLKLLTGNNAGAEAELREAWAMLDAMGETGILASITACLAEAVTAQGRYEEAVDLTTTSEAAAAEDDLAAQSEWRCARARALARLADEAAAEALAREAVVRSDASDFLNLRADARGALAEVLTLRGNVDEAAALRAEARSLYVAKGNASAARLLEEAAPPAAARSGG